MSPKHNKTLERVFQNPVPANIKWRGIETMLISLGAEIEEGRGSQVRFRLNDVAVFFHRPHPSLDTRQYAVKHARNFLVEAGICDAEGKLKQDKS